TVALATWNTMSLLNASLNPFPQLGQLIPKLKAPVPSPLKPPPAEKFACKAGTCASTVMSPSTTPVALNLKAWKSADPVFAYANGLFKCTVTSTFAPFWTTLTVPNIVPAGPQPPEQWSWSKLKSNAEAGVAPPATSAITARTNGHLRMIPNLLLREEFCLHQKSLPEAGQAMFFGPANRQSAVFWTAQSSPAATGQSSKRYFLDSPIVPAANECCCRYRAERGRPEADFWALTRPNRRSEMLRREAALHGLRRNHH